MRLLLDAVKKNVFFERAPRCLLLFDAKAIRGSALSIKWDRILCFRKSAAVLIFAPLILRVAFCQVYTVWIAFAVNLCYIWVHYYICSFNICDKREWALVSDQTWSKIWGLPQCKNQGTFSLFCTFCFPRFFCADFFVSFILRHTWVLQVVTGWAKICRMINSFLANPLSAYKQLKDR